MRPIVSLVLCLPAIAHTGSPLLKELQSTKRVWNRESLAKALFRACREPQTKASLRQVADWAKLLDDARSLRTDGSLTSGIQVREVALACIEELTGEDFYAKAVSAGSTREILSTINNGEVERFNISEIHPEDLTAIQKAIHSWLDKKRNTSK